MPNHHGLPNIISRRSVESSSAGVYRSQVQTWFKKPWQLPKEHIKYINWGYKDILTRDAESFLTQLITLVITVRPASMTSSYESKLAEGQDENTEEDNFDYCSHGGFHSCCLIFLMLVHLYSINVVALLSALLLEFEPILMSRLNKTTIIIA
uniref:Homeobox domain-containing protein n=1 Tax=Steinernema glaseri TaxID=37863 RepID=A0A1I7YC62_9BILA